MSQAKVDRYKEEKAHRKKNMQKEKYKSAATRICVVAVLAAIIVWGGYSVYDRYEKNQPTKYLEVDASAIQDYESSIIEAE